MDIDIFSWKHETIASGIKPIQSKHDRSKASTELATQFCPKGRALKKRFVVKTWPKHLPFMRTVLSELFFLEIRHSSSQLRAGKVQYPTTISMRGWGFTRNVNKCFPTGTAPMHLWVTCIGTSWSEHGSYSTLSILQQHISNSRV